MPRAGSPLKFRTSFYCYPSRPRESGPISAPVVAAGYPSVDRDQL